MCKQTQNEENCGGLTEASVEVKDIKVRPAETKGGFIMSTLPNAVNLWP